MNKKMFFGLLGLFVIQSSHCLDNKNTPDMECNASKDGLKNDLKEESKDAAKDAAKEGAKEGLKALCSICF